MDLSYSYKNIMRKAFDEIADLVDIDNGEFKNAATVMYNGTDFRGDIIIRPIDDDIYKEENKELIVRVAEIISKYY